MYHYRDIDFTIHGVRSALMDIVNQWVDQLIRFYGI